MDTDSVFEEQQLVITLHVYSPCFVTRLKL